MAKKTTLKLWTGTKWEDLFPSTRSDLVVFMNGENNLEHRLNTVEAVARGAQQSLAFENYAELVEYIKGLGANDLSVGQNMYIKELNVPDVWIYIANKDWTNYPFSGNEAFINSLNSENGVHVGHYVLAALETGKSVLTNQASSQVLVGGVHQSVWNADTKLDKITTATGLVRVYTINADGSQSFYNIATGANSAQPGRIPYLLAPNSTGLDGTPTATFAVCDPQKPYSIANKRYVDSNFVTKGAPKGTAVKLYGETSEGMVVHRLVNTAATPTQGTIPIYRENGTLAAGTPIETYHAANKEYVDSGFLAKTTVTSEMLLTQKVNGSTDKLGFDIATKPYYIVRRDASGDILVNDTPSSTSAAVNKKYVDSVAGGGSSGGLYKHTLYWETEDGEEVQLELFTTRSTRYSLIEDDTTPWIQMFSETISAKIILGGFEDEFSAVVSLYATEEEPDDSEYAMVVGLNIYYYYYSNRQLLEVSNIMGQSSFSYTVSKA